LLLTDASFAYVYGNGSVPLAQVDLADGSVDYLHTDTGEAGADEMRALLPPVLREVDHGRVERDPRGRDGAWELAAHGADHPGIVRSVGRRGVDVRVVPERGEVCIDVAVATASPADGAVYTVWDVDDRPWVLEQMREHGHLGRG